jgi:hypothetical protein
MERKEFVMTMEAIINTVHGLMMMKNQNMLMIFALMAALGLVTVVAVDLMLTMQEVDAAGCRNSVAVNASKGRCLKG